MNWAVAVFFVAVLLTLGIFDHYSATVLGIVFVLSVRVYTAPHTLTWVLRSRAMLGVGAELSWRKFWGLDHLCKDSGYCYWRQHDPTFLSKVDASDDDCENAESKEFIHSVA